MRVLFGTMDTRSNNEDFALTPYLCSVISKGEVIKVYGIGVCWGYFSFYMALGFNFPKEYPTFRNIKKEVQ